MLIKLKFRFPEILLGFLLAVAMFAVGMIFESSRHQESNKQTDQSPRQIEARHKPEPFTADWLTEDGTVFFTAGLALIAGMQAGLFVWQLRYMRKGMEDATIAARAAALSARAAIAIELPFIRAEPDQFGFGSKQDLNGPRIQYCSAGLLKLANVGRTKAIPIEAQYGWVFGDSLPDAPVYAFVEQFPISALIDKNGTSFLNLMSEFEFPEGNEAPYDSVRYERRRLWFFCRFVYLDFMGERHEAGFCWRRMETMGAGRFIEDRTPAYNRKT